VLSRAPIGHQKIQLSADAAACVSVSIVDKGWFNYDVALAMND
jgi:hypothetical protein